MTAKTNFSKKFMSIFLCFALLMTYLPLSTIIANAASRDSIERVADASTMNDWQKFFPTGSNINTENAGGVWTDKSVFTDDSAFSDITMTDTDSFLVSLSAMASNMTVTGMSSVPTDTMLVLDISDSMSNSASSLTTAANNTIKALLDSNKDARVGVVMYSGPSTFSSSDGSHASVVLPLARYTTSDSQGRFLNYSNDRISINNRTYYEGTTDKPTAITKQVIGGTYIQNGIDVAKDHFNAVTDTTVGDVKRTPIMVLMSDGAPTLASTNFTNPTNSTMGDGGNTSAAMGFVTQLSMSYAKQQMEAKYGTNALLYTLGVGLTSSSSDYQIARAVLYPSNTYTDSSANALKDDWDNYNAAATNSQITVSGRGNNAIRVTKIAETLEEESVDRYFAASGANDLVAVFEQIVAEISLQSKYYPTLVEENEDLSGYVTFVDKIGKYMEVTKVEGIRLHQTLFSGADLASNFVSGGGNLGTYDDPTSLGDEMVWAVQQRLGIDNIDTVRTLIALAYEHGQLSYTSATEFSNYIGWFADKDDKFLGFWYDGIADSAVPQGAVSIMKSYGYLGETDEAHGVAKSDMMYATVQVKEDIATKEQTVTFAVPAALIPTVTYEVTLDEKGDLEELEATGATAPIRLVYKVALREDINEYTVNELVDSAYLTANTNADGSVNFYTNQYEVDNTTGYGKVNTMSYFRPSRQNDRYYYQADSLVYTDTNGTEYKSATHPKDAAGSYYYKHQIYSTSEGKKVGYHELNANILAAADKNSDNTYSIKSGTVRLDYAGVGIGKENTNPTKTLNYSHVPFQDSNSYEWDDTNHSVVVGATLGNNGRLTLDRETGIKLTKALAAGTTATEQEFIFTISGTTAGTHNAYKVDANGTATDTTVAFNSSGEAVVTLKAGETLYIGGMTAAQSITVTETETDKYTVLTVNGKTGNADTVTLGANEFTDVAFVNTERGTGNLTVSKEVKHPFGTNYKIPDSANSFKFTVTLKLNGAVLDNKTYGDYSTDATGKIEQDITLKHGEQITIYGLPEGTEATVVETDYGNGFSPNYWDNGVTGDGVVTIEADRTSSVLVINDYTPTKVDNPIINLDVNKTLTGRAWNDTDTFAFELQKWNGTGWAKIGEQKSITKTNAQIDFDAEIRAEEYTEIGRYYYRVVEIEPANGIFGVSYDKALHGFAVVVTDENMDGALEVKTVERASTTDAGKVTVAPNGSGFDVTANFENVYAVNDTSVSIEVNKTVVNKSGSHLATLNGFNFKIYSSDSYGNIGAELTSNQFAATSTTGTTRISLNYSGDGTFYYAIEEVKGDKPGWTYSTATKYVTVIVNKETNGDKDYLVATAYSGLVADPATATDGSTSVTVGFENTYTPAIASIDLDVSKTLNGRDMNAGEFNFEITPYGNATDNPILNSEGNPVANNKLTASNAKADNGAKAVVDFPAMYFNEVGTFFYNVNETSTDANGVTTDKNTYRVTVTVVDNGGTLNATYQIINVQGNEIAFVNNYTPTPVSNAISGTKELTGRALLNSEFTFVLTEALDAEGNVATNAKTYTTENNVKTKTATTGTFTFPEITYDKVGTYYYVVTEQKDNGNATYGINYDDTKYVVTVVIKDDFKGNLKVDSVTYGTGIDEIVFKNEYKANPTSAVIPGNKILEGRVLSSSEFEFKLYESNASWSTGKELETVSNAANGNFEFNAINFDTAGTYYYLVKEVQGNKGGVTYDTTTFRVRVEITDDLRGQLHSSVHIYDDNDIPQASIVFNNTYAVTGTDTVVLEGNKTLNGRDMTVGEFTFELYETENDFIVDGEADKTATNNAEDEFKFTLEYKPEDIGKTFYYVVKEKNAGQTINGVTYSNVEYRISVKVEDDGEGSIKTTKEITANNLPAVTLDFTNTYDAEDATLIIGGEKELTGKELTDGEFTFNLYKADEYFVIDEGVAPQKAKNKANKTFAFESLTFSKVGTYYYVVEEDSSKKLDRVTYDDTKYYITVSVTDDTVKGKLSATYTIKTSSDATKNAENIVFENKYTPKPTDITVDININKKVENKGSESITAEGFEFALKKDGATESQKVKTDKDGKAKFTLNFTEEDIGKTYSYTLTEVDGGRANVKYSTAKYDIAITVSLDGNNKLAASITQNTVAVDSVVAEFVNEYDYTPPTPPTPPEDDIPSSPQTGDTSNIHLWFALLFVSGGGLIGTTVYGRKKKEETE